MKNLSTKQRFKKIFKLALVGEKICCGHKCYEVKLFFRVIKEMATGISGCRDDYPRNIKGGTLMRDPSHCFDDEELKCLIKARRCHKNGEYDMAWRLIDAAILAKYTLLAKQDKENKDGRNSMD